MTAPFILSAFSCAICIFSFFFFRWYIKRNTAAEQLLAEYRAEVYRLIAEIDSATDRDSLLVEERIKSLKQTLDDTDKRIAVYLRELDRSRSSEAMYANLGRGIRSALNQQKDAAPPPQGESRSVQPAAAGSQNPAEAPPVPGQNMQEAAALAGESAEAAMRDAKASRKHPGRKHPAHRAASSEGDGGANAKKPAVKSRRKTQIAEMAARGLSPAEIASHLDISLSEVDLALNLMSRW